MSTNIFTRLGIPEPVTAEGIAAFVIDSGDHCESWGSQFCTDHGCRKCYALVIEAYVAHERAKEREAITARVEEAFITADTAYRNHTPVMAGEELYVQAKVVRHVRKALKETK